MHSISRSSGSFEYEGEVYKSLSAVATHATRDATKRYRYYVCTAAQKRGWQSCPSQSIPAGEIERFVVDQIKCIGRDPQLVAETVRQARGQATERVERLAAQERPLHSARGCPAETIHARRDPGRRGRRRGRHSGSPAAARPAAGRRASWP
ncbi:MAG: recombinase zinc beta ribbon domain-containing protein [Pirellulales bacterium]